MFLFCFVDVVDVLKCYMGVVDVEIVVKSIIKGVTCVTAVL